MELSEKKLKTRDYVVIASLLFGLFFGAGNLIFPLHLGQLAGANWFPAMLGFLVTAVALPLLGVLAIAATHAEGVYDIGRPLGRFFALAFMVLIHATIGPMFGTPRTATVSFTTGVLPMLPKAWAQVGLLVFSPYSLPPPFSYPTRNAKSQRLLAKFSIQFSLSCYSSSSLLVSPIQWEIQQPKLSQQLIKMPAS